MYSDILSTYKFHFYRHQDQKGVSHAITLSAVAFQWIADWTSTDVVMRGTTHAFHPVYTWWRHQMETFSTLLAGHRWIPLTKASDAELWCFLWSSPEQTSEQTIETPVIWEAIALIMTSLYWYVWNKLISQIPPPPSSPVRAGYGCLVSSKFEQHSSLVIIVWYVTPHDNNKGKCVIFDRDIWRFYSIAERSFRNILQINLNQRCSHSRVSIEAVCFQNEWGYI